MPQAVPFIAGMIGTTAPAIGTAAFGAYVAGAGFSSWLTTSFVGRLLTGVAISALRAALTPKPRRPGIKTSSTAGGGTNPLSFILGRYATGGTMVCPAMSHSRPGKNRNYYLTYVIDLGDIPGHTLEGLSIDGNTVEIGTSAEAHADYGLPIKGEYDGYAWVRYYDGSQTAADPMLLDKYAGYPDRPWSADMVGYGTCYAILTFCYNRELFNSLPSVRFVMGGIPLYDPRKDDTVGGSGSHRWADRSTWEPSENTVVQIYNIMRGIEIPGLGTWGGGVDVDAVPIENWFTGMNACDVAIALADGGTEPQYRSSLEVSVNEEPAAVIEELLRCCSGKMAEVGGVWKIRVGAPGLPVFFFTDGNIIINKPQDIEPFPGLSQTYNAVLAAHPDPDSNWEAHDAPGLFSEELEAEDGGKRLPATLTLPAAPYGKQVQRLMSAYLKDQRRFRRHVLTLTMAAAVLEPLDVAAWTSTANGYDVKSFEIGRIVDHLRSGAQRPAMREVDPDDYNWSPANERPTSAAPSGWTRPAPQPVEGWDLVAVTIDDAGSNARRPALKLVWDGDLGDTAQGIRWEIRLAGTTSVALRGSTQDLAAGYATVADGILPATDYEARAELIMDAPTEWSGWAPATTDDVRLGATELTDDLTVVSVPTGLALSTELVSDGRAMVRSAWNAASNAVGYEVGLTVGGGNEVVLVAGDTAFEIEVLAGLSCQLRVRSVSAVGQKSGWTALSSITAAADGVPPAVPNAPTLTAGFNSIWVEWPDVSDTDLAYYELNHRATNTVPAENPAVIVKIVGNAWVHAGLDDNQTRYYAVRAVDTSGNRSEWSTVVGTTTKDPALTGVTAADIQGLVDQTSFATGLTSVEIVATLPTTGNFEGRTALLTADGKLYRYTSGAWTNEVDGADLKLASVVAGAIAAGAVGAEQIAAKAITGKHVLIGDFENLNLDPEFEGGVWEYSSGATYIASGDAVAWGSKNVIEIVAGTTSYGVVNGSIFEVDPEGEEFYVDFRAQRMDGTSGGGYLQLKSSTSESMNVSVGYSASPEADSVSLERVTATLTVPPGKRYARFQIVKSNSGHTTDRIGGLIIRRRKKGELFVDGFLRAVHVGANEVITNAANIKNAVITDAKIADLSAAKLIAGTALTSSLTVDGTALSTVNSRAADPAARVNAVNTQIDPGKIVISGGTSLADWRRGGDETMIDGGAISANTVTANKIAVGNRGVDVFGIEFETSGNTLTWSGGEVRYIDDNNAAQVVTITGGSIGYGGSGRIYVYYVQGATTLSTTYNATTSMGGFVLATYRGGSDLVTQFGRTIIDGDYIKTGAIDTEHLAAKIVTASKLVVGDTTNFAAGCDFESAAAVPFDLTSGMGLDSNYKYTGGKSLKINAGAPTTEFHQKMLVTTGEQIYVEFYAQKSTYWDGGGNSKLRFYNATPGGGNAYVSALSYAASDFSSAYSWKKRSHVFTVPAGCTQLGVQVNNSDASTGAVWLDNIMIRHMTGGTLIENGAVTTDKIKFNAAVLADDGSGNLTVTSNGITRTLLDDQSASDGGSVVTYSSGGRLDNTIWALDVQFSDYVNISTENAVKKGQCWRIAVHGEYRTNGEWYHSQQGTNYGETQLRVLYRTTTDGTNWTGWSTLKTASGNATTAWEYFDHDFSIMGNFKDVQVIIQALVTDGSGTLQSAINNVRNIMCHARALER